MAQLHRVIVGGKPPKALLLSLSGSLSENESTNADTLDSRSSSVRRHTFHYSSGIGNQGKGQQSKNNGRVDTGILQSNRRNASVSRTGNDFALKEHQLEAVEKLGKAEITARLIGDEMRVGKTPTAIAIDQSLRNQIGRQKRGNNCTLIVCPKSVLSNWVDHLTWMDVPPNQICTIDLPSKQALKKRLGRIAADKRKSNAKQWFIVLNWDSVQTIRSELQRAGPWFHIIGDEIHRIKGRTTKRTESFKRVKAKQKTGLSGTPADNRPEDFWSVLHWLRPNEFSSYWNFVDAYCSTRVTKSGFKQITGVRAKALPELRAAIAPFYIRRMLVDVADSLPQKQYRTIHVEMGARQRREYDEFDKKDIVDLEGGDTLAVYRVVKDVRKQQMAIGRCKIDDDGEVHITDDSPKLDTIMEYIKDQEDDAGPYIIFAQYHDSVKLLSARLQAKGESVSSIIGTSTAEERSDAVALFQSGQSDFFVGSIGACREGITLNRANTILFVDRAWNPNWNRQAEARADSLDSHLPVTVVYFQTVNSIDEHRRLRIDQKGRDTDAMTRMENDGD